MAMTVPHPEACARFAAFSLLTGNWPAAARRRVTAQAHDFRRLVIRWEFHVQNFFGMVRLGCIQILLRQL
jgi:hypothetical protein